MVGGKYQRNVHSNANRWHLGAQTSTVFDHLLPTGSVTWGVPFFWSSRYCQAGHVQGSSDCPHHKQVDACKLWAHPTGDQLSKSTNGLVGCARITRHSLEDEGRQDTRCDLGGIAGGPLLPDKITTMHTRASDVPRNIGTSSAKARKPPLCSWQSCLPFRVAMGSIKYYT